MKIIHISEDKSLHSSRHATGSRLDIFTHIPQPDTSFLFTDHHHHHHPLQYSFGRCLLPNFRHVGQIHKLFNFGGITHFITFDKPATPVTPATSRISNQKKLPTKPVEIRSHTFIEADVVQRWVKARIFLLGLIELCGAKTATRICDWKWIRMLRYHCLLPMKRSW